MPDALLDLLFGSSARATVVFACTLALATLAVLVPRNVPAARASLTAAAVSPLWLVLPVVLAFLLALLGAVKAVAVSVAGQLIGPFLVIQVLLSAWVLWRHRRWPWIVLLLAVALYATQWAILAAGAISQAGFPT